MGHYTYVEALEDIIDPNSKLVVEHRGTISQWLGVRREYPVPGHPNVVIEYGDKRFRYEHIHAPATLQDVANVFEVELNRISGEEPL